MIKSDSSTRSAVQDRREWRCGEILWSAYEVCDTVLSGNQRFGGTYCFHLSVQGAVWAHSSEILLPSDWHCLSNLPPHLWATSCVFIARTSQQLDQFSQNLVLKFYVPQSNYTDIGCIIPQYSVIKKDGLNFVGLYFLNYTWYANDLHNIWKRRS